MPNFLTKQQKGQSRFYKALPVENKNKQMNSNSPALSRKDNENSVPSGLRKDFEQYSGLSYENVRIHYSSDRPAAFGAAAYTQNNHIYVAPGQERYIPHELGHIMQQRLLNIPPTSKTGGENINFDPLLERNADQIAAEAMAGNTSLLLQKNPTMVHTIPPVQAYAEISVMSENLPYIIQLEHANFSNCEEVKAKADDAQAAPLPTEDLVIVYESFGGDAKQLFDVYQQSCSLSGNTICILGLNRKLNSGENFYNPTMPDTTALATDIQNHGKLNTHKAFILPFVWIDTPENSGYTFPYFEVRHKLMIEASEITKNFTTCLFRWIDRDATEDTTGKIKPEDLEDLANQTEAMYFTGAYKWGTTKNIPLISIDGIFNKNGKINDNFLGNFKKNIKILLENSKPKAGESKRAKSKRQEDLKNALTALNLPNTPLVNMTLEAFCEKLIKDNNITDDLKDITEKELKEKYANATMNLIIEELNKAEAELREFWFKLVSKLDPEIGNPHGFYLPEPLLLVNRAAHNKLMANLNSQISTAEANNSGQARESATAFGDESVKYTVAFRPEFSVVKPNKTLPGDGEKKYLHDLEEMLYKDKYAEFNENVLFLLLQNTRQSAFSNSNWFFVKGSQAELSNEENVDIETVQSVSIADAQRYLDAERSYLVYKMYANIKNIVERARQILSPTDTRQRR